MSRHTPGPWVVEERENGHWQVKSMYWSDEEPGICGDHSKHWTLSKEDADLIAAAPELLAALKHMVFFREAKNGNKSGTDGRYDRARAAIAKAEGR